MPIYLSLEVEREGLGPPTRKSSSAVYRFCLIDGFAGLHGTLAESIGSRVDATLELSGNDDSGMLTIDARAPRALVDAELELKDGFLTTSRTASARIGSTDLLTLMPFFAKLASSANLEAWPSVALEIAELRLPVGDTFERGMFDARAIDWREAKLALAIDTGEATGLVRMTADGIESASDR